MASGVGVSMRLGGTIIMTYLEAIRNFLVTTRPEPRILQHSLQGVQFTAQAFTGILEPV
jgi:hypothetical protein